MRKILITLVILIACIAAVSATWIFRGRQVSLFLDRFGTIETASARVNSIVYEGSGTGGILHINDLALGLNDKNGPTPNIGTTKDNQLGLATVPPAGDDAFIRIRRSALSWPTPFDFNFMTGHSPSWKRHRYYQLVWNKPSGAKLEMLWRYEQYFYPGDGWGSAFMTREGFTGLIEVDIHP